MYRFPLKQSVIDYFNLNLIDDKVSNEEFSDFLVKVLESSQNPLEKALDIWDTFVMTNNDFFDIPERWTTKEKRLLDRDDILNSNNVYEISMIFANKGVSSFCNRC
jgi:hypothetical protein